MKADAAADGTRASEATEDVRRRCEAAVRKRTAFRFATTTLVGTAAAVVLLEVVARVTFVEHLRTFEFASGIVAAAAGLLDAIRRLRCEPHWRLAADQESPEPGVFSAAAHAAAGRSRFAPLLADRAARAARSILSTPRRNVTGPLRPLHVAEAVVLASILVAMPGKEQAADALRPQVATALQREAAALTDVAKAEQDPVRRAELESAAERLKTSTPRARDVRAAAAAVRALSKTETLEAFRQLATAAPALRPLLKAANAGEARAVDAAKAALLKLIEEDAEVRSAILEALRRVNTAVAGGAGDPDLRTATTKLSGSDGSGAVDALARAAERAATEAHAEQVLRDVVVRLDAAAGAAGTEAKTPGTATPKPAPSAGAANPGVTGPAALPPPPDFGIFAAPGSVEETVLKRYFDPTGG